MGNHIDLLNILMAWAEQKANFSPACSRTFIFPWTWTSTFLVFGTLDSNWDLYRWLSWYTHTHTMLVSLLRRMPIRMDNVNIFTIWITLKGKHKSNVYASNIYVNISTKAWDGTIEVYCYKFLIIYIYSSAILL